ncbi:tyrosine-type recombinase/integrase [Falsirhodobacter deserti]|uniref:tyrosine-type recombinase/integrase n=1 Tax=Falsirhodobacter deserti TaxID=1365611 RepID=UPI000FE3633A|nr:site-specific integrase [Falsirhodobacter deserti]
MSRTYSAIRPKQDRVYSGEQVIELYEICRNTLGNWIASGLRPSDDRLPRIFRGSELARFHKERRGTKVALRRGQFHCLGCKACVFPDVTTLSFSNTRSGSRFANATCPDCHATMWKILNETDRDAFEICKESNTSLSSLDEGNAQAPACIGQDQGESFVSCPSPNDRLLLDWQAWAARYDEKTIVAHLRAIRQFEASCGYKPFDSVTTDDAAAWREAITVGKPKVLSVSTVQHQASHLRAFFAWLAKRPGYRALLPVPEYFELPRRFAQKGISDVKAYAEIDEAERLLEAMPKATIKDRRARAIFATAYISGLRANALITLRLRHVDIEKRLVFHDGTELRAKNGKSFVVNWFPRTETFQAVLLDWLEEVTRRSLRSEDALFPELRDLEKASVSERAPFAPMKSANAVTEAFSLACRDCKEVYSPHSVGHTLAQLGDRICRTSEERKAWSLNLGHNSEEVTWTYYGKVTDMRRGEIFKVFEQDQPATSIEKDLMLAYHEHLLIRGSPEFDQAEKLIEQRRQGRMQWPA